MPLTSKNYLKQGLRWAKSNKPKDWDLGLADSSGYVSVLLPAPLCEVQKMQKVQAYGDEAA